MKRCLFETNRPYMKAKSLIWQSIVDGVEIDNWQIIELFGFHLKYSFAVALSRLCWGGIKRKKEKGCKKRAMEVKKKEENEENRGCEILISVGINVMR